MQTISHAHQAVIDRFVEQCRADERVVAAFLGGSFARGAADAYSDLDLSLIVSDAAYADFFAERIAFIRSLGDPLFLEDYRGEAFDIVFFTFAGGIECELVLSRESEFTQSHVGLYQILLDAKGILAGAVFPRREVPHDDQIETLRGMLAWFWHDLSHHLIGPLARGRLWSAYAGLEQVRMTCVNLIRLKDDFAAVPMGYERVEEALTDAQLAPLAATCCALDRDTMLQAACRIVEVYREMATPLAQQHSVAYPMALDAMMTERLANL